MVLTNEDKIMFSKSDKKAMKKAYEGINTHTAEDYRLKNEAAVKKTEYAKRFKKNGVDADILVFSHSDQVSLTLSNEVLIKILDLMDK